MNTSTRASPMTSSEPPPGLPAIQQLRASRRGLQITKVPQSQALPVSAVQMHAVRKGLTCDRYARCVVALLVACIIGDDIGWWWEGGGGWFSTNSPRSFV